MSPLWRTISLPVDDYFAALRACFADFDAPRAIAFLGSLAACWWLYVPVHELLHVAGCILTGGEVTRLEIAPIYAGPLLERIFPFVVSGSEYAGRLSGFDTRGSDLTYLATDFAPYLITIFIGVPLLRAAAKPAAPAWKGCGRLGAAVPLAYVPFISLTGDYYEMGSIIVSRVVAFFRGSFDVDRWRGDDLFKLVGEIHGAGAADWVGIGSSFALGVVLAFGTYACGAWFAGKAGKRQRATGNRHE